MPKKWDPDSDDYTEEYDKFSAAENVIKSQIKEGQTRGFGPNLERTVGICSTCSHYNVALNDVHQVVLSACERYNTRLTTQKISYCSGHKPKGQLTLAQMYDMAILIDKDQKTNSVVEGFINTKVRRK